MENLLIKSAQKSQINQLNSDLHANIPLFHENKIAEQEKDESAWLIAWLGDKPVGHLQIRFSGPTETEIKSILKNVSNLSHVESIGVKEEYRRRGIGTALIKRAEELAQENGSQRVGMAVGVEDNPYAKKLYENLGYHDWGKGIVTVSWDIINKSGETVTKSEACVYLIKQLNHTPES